MDNNFIYDIPTKVYFGDNQLQNLGAELKRFGNRVLLTYGGGSIKKTGLYDRVLDEIKSAGLEVFELSGIEPNPRIESVRAGVKICKEKSIDVLLAVGGGSTIDATKFIAAGAKVEHDPWDFFVKAAPINSALPIVTILTIAAAGSEMDNGGVISNPETNDKIGRKSNLLFPKVSFLDPTITFTVSKYQTACGAADILSHLMEIYFHIDSDMYMLETIMESIMKTVIKYTPIALDNPNDYDARANIMWASSWAINGFVRAGKTHDWSCHSMEHQLSAFYDITHGLGLAILTPRWLKYCLDETTVNKIAQFGINVFDIDKNLDKMEIANLAIEKLSKFLFETLGLDDTLTKVGIGKENISLMAKKACKGGVINGFKKLNQQDIENIYLSCL